MNRFLLLAIPLLAWSCVAGNSPTSPEELHEESTPTSSVQSEIFYSLVRNDVEFLVTETVEETVSLYSVPRIGGEVLRDLGASSTVLVSGRSSEPATVAGVTDYWYWVMPYRRGQSPRSGIGWIHGSAIKDIPQRDSVKVGYGGLSVDTDTGRSRALVEIEGTTLSTAVLSESDQEFVSFRVAPTAGHRFYFPVGFYVYDMVTQSLSLVSHIPLVEPGRPYLSDDRKYLLMDMTTGPVTGGLSVYEVATGELVWRGGFNLSKLDLGSTVIEEVVIYHPRFREQIDGESLAHFDAYLESHDYDSLSTDLYVFYETDFATGARTYIETVATPAQ